MSLRPGSPSRRGPPIPGLVFIDRLDRIPARPPEPGNERGRRDPGRAFHGKARGNRGRAAARPPDVRLGVDPGPPLDRCDSLGTFEPWIRKPAEGTASRIPANSGNSAAMARMRSSRLRRPAASRRPAARAKSEPAPAFPARRAAVDRLEEPLGPALGVDERALGFGEVAAGTTRPARSAVA